MLRALRHNGRWRAALFMALLLLAGCSSVWGGRDRDKPTLAETSYRAADMLSQQTQASLGRDTPLQIGMIGDIGHPAAITPFGRTVGSQLAARFVQLGYNVSASTYDEVSGGAPPPALYGGGYGVPAAVTLTGQYTVAREEVLVNLRLLDAGSSRAIAAYDYSVPLTRDVKELTVVPGARKGWFGF